MSDFSILPFLEKNFTLEEPIILGCSTGADSMFLLYKILETPYRKNLVASYFNHHTREQCVQEENFLLELGKKENFQVEIGECDFEKIKKLYPSKSFEELAREKRFQFFDALCHIYETQKVLLAHHLDDKIETFFFHMLRGSKLSGLVNMQENSGGILRPLLKIQKRDIYDFLHKNNLSYFEDETNLDSKYTRNYLRNEVLPLLEKVHPEHKKNLSSLLEYFSELKEYLENEVKNFLGEKNTFYLEDFFKLSDFLQKEVVRYIYYITNGKSTIGLTQANISEILRFFHGKNNPSEKTIKALKLYKSKGNITFVSEKSTKK